MAPHKKLGLTEYQTRFVQEYCIDYNQRLAAIRAGCEPRNAASYASRWLQIPAVQNAIHNKKIQIEERAEMTAVDVLLALKSRATADPRELVEMRNDCCRYCYGRGNLYQETPREYRERMADYAKLLEQTPQSEWSKLPQFDEMGGKGYDPRKPPRDDCPECWGRGIEQILFKDSRSYSKNAQAIYEGVKRTKDGFELKTASREKALLALGNHLGLFKRDDSDASIGVVVFNSPSHDPTVDDSRETGTGDL
jgi:hypothetical protein